MKIERLGHTGCVDIAEHTLAPVVGYPKVDQIKIRFAPIVKHDPSKPKSRKSSSIRFNVVLSYEEAVFLIKQLVDRLASRGRQD